MGIYGTDMTPAPGSERERKPNVIGDGMKKDSDDSPAPPDSATDVAFVRALAEVLRENGLEELEVGRHRKGGEKLTVRISRNARVTPVASAPAIHTAPAAMAPSEPPAEPALSGAADGDLAGLPGAVVSPMVGTAYLGPEPGADPFVNVGDSVTEGQTLLIVEAMKTMNQIPATRSGVVKRVLVEDATPVEYGAPLMIVG